MKLNQLMLLILLIIPSYIFAQQSKYEPSMQSAKIPRDYYGDSLGVDTRTRCDSDETGRANNPRRLGCIPATAEFECTGYSYLTDANKRSFQFCKVGTIFNSEEDRVKLAAIGFATSKPVDGYVATGYFNANGVFSHVLPGDVKFVASPSSTESGIARVDEIQDRPGQSSWVRAADYGIDISFSDMLKRRQSKNPLAPKKITATQNTNPAQAIARAVLKPTVETPKPSVPLATPAQKIAQAVMSSHSEATVCAPGMACYETEPGKITQFAIATERTVTSASSLQALPQGEELFSNGCYKFIKKDGNYGSLGARLSSEFDRPEYSQFTADSTYEIPGIKGVCPKYNTLSKEMRKRFWVWAFASITMDEKACGDYPYQHPTPRPPAGIFQLEANPSLRRARIKGLRRTLGNPKRTKPSSYEFCYPEDITPHLDNTLCAMDIMLGTLIGQYGDPMFIIDGKGVYWEETGKGLEGKVPKLIKEFKACQN